MDCPTDIMQLASSPWLIERENGRTLMATMRAMLTSPATARDVDVIYVGERDEAIEPPGW